MFKGDTTLEEYCRCLTTGFCEKHLKEFGKDADSQEGQQLQRKTLLYMRLHLLNPFLYGKSYSVKCMQDLASKCSIFPKEGFYSEKNFTPGLRETIILFDSVMTYTLCYLSKVCCTAGLFMEARQEYRHENGITSFLQKLIAARKLSSDEINTFFKTLKSNFENFDVELVKEANLMTLLYVRELRSVKLSVALQQLEKNLLEQPASENFKRIGIEDYNNENYKESISAYNSALQISPYNFAILSKRAQSYLKLKKYEEAELDSRASVIICSSWDKGYCNLVSSLLYQEYFDEAHLISLFGIQNCEYFPSKSLDTLKCLAKECLSKVQEKCLDQQEFSDEIVESNEAYGVKSDSLEQMNDIPDLTDSSSGESDTEVVVKEVKELNKLKEVNKLKNEEIQQHTPLQNKFLEVTPKEKTPLQNKFLEVTPKEKTIGTNQKKPLASTLVEETSKEKNYVTNQKKSLTTKLAEETSKEKNNEKAVSLSKLPEITTREKSYDKTVTVNTLPEVTTKEKIYDESLERRIETTLKEASVAMSAGSGHLAMSGYLTVLNELKKTPLHKYSEQHIVNFKYVYGSSCISSGTYEDLQKCISTFKEIIEEHSNVIYPAAYYGLGLAYRKLNRFKDATVYLDKVYSFLQKGILFKTFNWPGTVAVIEETKHNILQPLVEELKTVCANPPEPNAICRYESCSFNPPIYYNDPDFKGFLKILCSEQCKLQYHPACWKTFKSTKSDKEYLDQSCLTPDCLGTVIRIEYIGKDGNSEKIFQSEEWDKGRKATKQKKSKLEKKLDKNEQRRRKRHTSITLSCSKSDTPEATIERESITDESVADLGAEIVEQHTTEDVSKENKVVENVSNELSVNAEPFMVIKKNITDKEENMQKTFKQKDRKKGGSKKTKLSIDEFCAGEISYYNEYQMRLNKLQENKQIVEGGSVQWANLCETEKIPDLDPSRPFYIPEGLRDDRYTLETVLQSVNNSSENDVTRSIKESLYQYFEGILSYKGPLKLNDPQLTKEFEDFPNEAKAVINENGGFKSFMLKSMRFAIVKDYVCTITDVIKAYDMPSDYQSDQTFGNADELDYFSADTAYEENEFNDQLSDSFSHLNPHASEYKPLHQQSQNKDYLEQNSSDDSNSLLSVVNQLRQPITQAQQKCTEPAEKSETNSLKVSYSKFHVKNEYQANEVLRKEDYSFNAVKSVWDIPCSSNDKQTMLGKLNEIVKWFFSDEVVQEDRKQINCDIKPYALVKIPQKQNKCIQGILPEVEMVSIGVMKEDDELNNIIELNKYLEIENSELIEHKVQLEEKLTHSLDSATKNQKKIIVDNSLLKKELEDIKLELENKKIDRTQLEIEQKHLQQLLNKSLEEIRSHKKEVEKSKADNERYELRVKELKDQLTIAEAEKESLSLHESEAKEAVEKIILDLNEMEQRARNAEVGMLKIIKDDFFKIVENKILEAQKKTKEIQTCLNSLVQNLEPYYTSSITALLLKIHDYIKNLREIQKEFGLMLDTQIEKIRNGACLSDFKHIVVPELPEIPSYSDENFPKMQIPPHPPPVIPPNFAVNNCNPAMAVRNQPLKGMYYPPNITQSSLLGNPLLINPAQNSLLGNPPLINPAPSLSSRLFPTPVPNSSQPGPVNIPLNKYPSTTPSPISQSVSGLSNIFPVPDTRQSKLPSYVDPKSASRSSSASPISKYSPDNLALKSTDAATLSSLETKNENGNIDLPVRMLKDTSSVSSDGSETSKLSSSNIVNNAQIELGYSVSKSIAQKKMGNKNSEKLGSVASLTSQKQDSYNSYAKLKNKLQHRFPQYELSQLMGYISKIREQNNNKLSGLSMEIIIKKVEELIVKDNQNQTQNKAKSRPAVLINKNLVSTAVEEKPPQLQKSYLSNPWSSHVNNTTLQWSGESADKTCIICYEDMSSKTGPKSAYRVDCGHKFHHNCIKTWLDKNSNCPTCRQHVLLPDDYPSLA